MRVERAGGPTIRRVSDLDPSAASAASAAGHPAAIVPAASVILLRDGTDGLEVLLVRRTAKASFAADAWVFPGGRIDPEDGLDPLSMEAARQGAARETLEEAGMVVDPGALIPYARWSPPPESPKRFLTWLFVVAAEAAAEVTVDGGEITEHEWIRPADALAARDAGRVTLLAPTFVTICDLAGRADVAAVLQAAQSAPPRFFQTHIAFMARSDNPEKREVVSLWEGDAGYESRDASATGPRHRLLMGEAPWHYERSL